VRSPRGRGLSVAPCRRRSVYSVTSSQGTWRLLWLPPSAWLFLRIRGQSCASQARITSSSRPFARTAGTWGLQPDARSRAAKEFGWSLTPYLASDDVADPFQGPTVGLESRSQGPRAEDPQDAPPPSGVPPRRSPCPGSTPKGPQPGSGTIAQSPGPMLNSPQADARPLGDFGLGQSSGSERSPSLEPTFFNLALSQFARAPQD
jgi:hypothetical protein